MGAAVDPTYPLYPLAAILASAGLLLVLLTSFIRQKWNLGVTFLCFWLLLENLTGAVNTIIWSENADVKLYAYCDIVTHLQGITSTVKPMATLITSRRLYIIASLQSVELPSKAARRRDLLIEWTLGLVIPVLVAGPIYYLNQGFRFGILAGFGCSTAEVTSILQVLIDQSWTVVPPFLSVLICIYHPRVARIFYKQSRDVNAFLRSNGSVSRTNYLRILALASVDVLFTLPFGIVNIVLNLTDTSSRYSFYPGWSSVHRNVETAVSVTRAEMLASGSASIAGFYLTVWTSPILAFIIFGLFGLTADARASYWDIICTFGGRIGWKPSPRGGSASSQLGTMEFGGQPQEMISLDAEMGSRPSFIDTNLVPHNRDATAQSDANPSEGATAGAELNEKINVPMMFPMGDVKENTKEGGEERGRGRKDVVATDIVVGGRKRGKATEGDAEGPRTLAPTFYNRNDTVITRGGVEEPNETRNVSNEDHNHQHELGSNVLKPTDPTEEAGEVEEHAEHAIGSKLPASISGASEDEHRRVSSAAELADAPVEL